MSDAYITTALRTPIGRAGGVLAGVRPDDLAAIAVRAVVERAGVPGERIDDVILGCANQAGEDNRNVARMAALLAGLPITVPGQTVNRLCGSGLQAVATAANTIKANEAELIVAGGVESMTRAPYVMLKSGTPWDRTPPSVVDSTVGWRFVNPRMPRDWTISLGQTAERVAESYQITREEQDAFAVESQRRAQAALASGAFAGEIVGVEVQRGGATEVVDRDEPPRPDVTAESLARLRPAFVEDGTVTAGSSSGINDGASALGHPLGASGARILTTLVHALQRSGGRYGLATMCIGVGQGIAMVVERGGPLPS